MGRMHRPEGAEIYKQTSEATHFLPRKASHSTKGSRNGRVDVLPPGAEEALWDVASQIADGEARLETLRATRDVAESELHRLSKIDQWRGKASRGDRLNERSRIATLEATLRAIEGNFRATRKQVASLKALLGSSAAVSFEGAFVALAKIELHSDVYLVLADKARALVARSARK